MFVKGYDFHDKRGQKRWQVQLLLNRMSMSISSFA